MLVIRESKIIGAVYSEGKLIICFLHFKIKYKGEMFGMECADIITTVHFEVH